MKQEYDVVGHEVPRVDGEEKGLPAAPSTSRTFRCPGLLHGAVLRSPYPHARILRLDTSRARALPGVRAVVTAEDTAKRAWGAFVRDQPVLAIDKVRYVGEEIAAVAAGDRETAREAMALIDVEYEELPAVFDPERAMQPDAPVLHDERGTNVAITIDVERGDVEAAFAASDVIVEETFAKPSAVARGDRDDRQRRASSGRAASSRSG